LARWPPVTDSQLSPKQIHLRRRAELLELVPALPTALALLCGWCRPAAAHWSYLAVGQGVGDLVARLLVPDHDEPPGVPGHRRRRCHRGFQKPGDQGVAHFTWGENPDAPPAQDEPQILLRLRVYIEAQVRT
jgi:hypothetical protein